MMILDAILAETRKTVAARRAACPEKILREEIGRASATRPSSPQSVVSVLRAPGVSIIAEIKRASPSRGAFTLPIMSNQPSGETPTPPNQGLASVLAPLYARAGAAMISVLTEPSYFQGSLMDLGDARRALAEASLDRPLLRKDVILDPYQLLEARAWGADAVLLIAAVLDDTTLHRLFDEALALGLTPLIEVHDELELARVLPLRPPLVGINNRNLRDFTVSLDVTRRLRPLVPSTSVVIAESGIHTPTHMRELAALGIDAALIGEGLVTARDPFATLRALQEAGK